MRLTIKMTWPGSMEAVEQSENGEGSMSNEEKQSLESDKVVPFPRELPPQFVIDLCHVMDINILVDLWPGSGNKMCGVLSTNLRALCIPSTKAQKDFIMENLMNYVESRKLLPEKVYAKWDKIQKWEATSASS